MTPTNDIRGGFEQFGSKKKKIKCNDGAGMVARDN
jgi:hypothetical protein